MVKRGARLAISIVAGVAAALLAFVYGSSVRADAEAAQQEALARYGGELVGVCVATRDIEPGDTLDEGNVQVEQWVSSLLPLDALTSIADVSGKVATSRIPERAVLCPVYLESAQGALEVPKGRVAVCVACDASHAVGGALEQGDEVDVYVSKDGIADRLTAASVLDTSTLANGGGDLAWVTLSVLPSRVSELLAASVQGQIMIVVPGEPSDDAEAEGAQAEGASTDPAAVSAGSAMGEGAAAETQQAPDAGAVGGQAGAPVAPEGEKQGDA